MATVHDPANGVYHTERVLSAGVDRVFAAFENPGDLATWWGPDGFTNTFEQFEFTPGGRWVYVMHGPNGHDYPNESVFRDIEPCAGLVIEHVCQPRYTLTVTLTSEGDSTRLSWTQVFEVPNVGAKLRTIVEPANEQNLDRLELLLRLRRD